MDYVSVVSGDARMHEKLELFQGRTLDGHAPGLGDEDMAAYAMVESLRIMNARTLIMR